MDTRSATADSEIASLRAAFVTALMAGDAKTACAVYADEATLVPFAAARLHGRDAIEGFWVAGLEAGMSQIELEVEEVESSCALSYELGRYTISLESLEGHTVRDRGTYLFVHERDAGGAWRRAVEMFSPAVTSDHIRLAASARGKEDTCADV